MKQKFLVCLTMVLLLALGLMGAALAESADVPPQVRVELSEETFSGPADVQVTVTVTNTSGTDMAGPCVLYNPDGVINAEFGRRTLAAGQSHIWAGTWHVTEEHLTTGRIPFAIGYTIASANGPVPKTQNMSVNIVNTAAEARLEVSRTITPATARRNQKVYVTYTIQNVGGLDVTDLTLRESSAVSDSAVTLGNLAAGATTSHTFVITMGRQTLNSRATVSYAANGQNGTVTVEDAPIQYADVKLHATLSANKRGGHPGEEVKLTLKLENKSNADITGITVTDPALGVVFTDQTVEANKSLTLEKTMTVTETVDLLFSVSGVNASGDTVATATERVNILATDPARDVHLTVTAEADSNTIYTIPGIVKFTVHVTNTSAVEATGVTVRSSGVTVYPYNTANTATIAPGETLSFVRDVLVEYPGNFRFDARATNQLGNSTTFEGNLVRIYHAPPTSTPTMAPISTPAAPVTEPLPESIDLPASLNTAQQALNIGFWALLGLAGVCLALVITGIVGRSASNAKANSAADSITRTGSNDYTKSVSNRRRHYMPEEEMQQDDYGYESDDPAYEEPYSEEPYDPETLDANMQEAMSELYPDAAQMDENAVYPYEEAPYEEAPYAPQAYAEEDADATYRRRRRSSQDE